MSPYECPSERPAHSRMTLRNSSACSCSCRIRFASTARSRQISAIWPSTTLGNSAGRDLPCLRDAPPTIAGFGIASPLSAYPDRRECRCMYSLERNAQSVFSAFVGMRGPGPLLQSFDAVISWQLSIEPCAVLDSRRTAQLILRCLSFVALLGPPFHFDLQPIGVNPVCLTSWLAVVGDSESPLRASARQACHRRLAIASDHAAAQPSPNPLLAERVDRERPGDHLAIARRAPSCGVDSIQH